MLTRREFILKTFEYGGFGAIAMMGLEREARAWGIMPAMTSSSDNSYSAWGELTKESLGRDQNYDGTEDTYTVFMESAAGNEVGVGVLTGADLVCTITGAPGAATGTPPYRDFDGGNDFGNFTVPFSNVVANGTDKWAVILKGEDWAEGQTNNQGPMSFEDANPNQAITASVPVGGEIKVYLEEDTNVRINAATVGKMTINTMIHFCWWSDGVYAKCGWIEGASGSGANGQPTKLSDFDSNNIKSYTGSVSFSNGDFDTFRHIMYIDGQPWAGKLYYAILSGACLIDNNA